MEEIFTLPIKPEFVQNKLAQHDQIFFLILLQAINIIVFHGNLIIHIKLLNAGPTDFKSRIFL